MTNALTTKSHVSFSTPKNIEDLLIPEFLNGQFIIDGFLVADKKLAPSQNLVRYIQGDLLKGFHIEGFLLPGELPQQIHVNALTYRHFKDLYNRLKERGYSFINNRNIADLSLQEQRPFLGEYGQVLPVLQFRFSTKWEFERENPLEIQVTSYLKKTEIEEKEDLGIPEGRKNPISLFGDYVKKLGVGGSSIFA